VLASLLLTLAGPAAAQRVVSPDGPYRSLAEAVAAAAPGERIVVKAGTYDTRDVTVDRRVEIVGEGWPVLDAGGEHQALVVTADSVTVRGVVFRNVATSFIVDRAAVRFEEVDGCLVEGNRFEGTFFGVYLARSTHCLVRHNVFRGRFRDESNSGNAIHLWSTVSSVVEGNDVQGHRDGIYLEFARHTEVRDNDSRGNFRYGLHFMFSDSSAYYRNTFTTNGAGVTVMYSRRVHMEGNRFLDSWGAASYGLLLKDLTDARVERNEIAGNSVGLFVQGSDRLSVTGNTFRNNGWAIKLLQDSDEGRYVGNSFTGNAFDVSTNSTSNSSRFDANYWDNYRGYDLDRDGRGDVPHRPVRFFSLLVERNRPALLLMRSVFVDLLDVAERVFPVLTPETLVDRNPRMREDAP
jgi:nitrous oxidase accessory protein